MTEPTCVLIVEDDMGNALLAQDAISGHFENCVVDIVSDGEECMRLLGQKVYDVVLLDQNLPDIEGLFLFKQYREAGFDIPTIMVTGSGNEEIAVEAMKSGVYDYIVKTADLGYLKALPFVVQEGLHRRQMERELEKAHAQEVELERLKAVQAIVVSLSHEINNPLAVVLGTIQLLLSYPHQELNEDTLTQLKMVEEHANRIKDLVHKLNKIDHLHTTPYVGEEMMVDIERSAKGDENAS